MINAVSSNLAAVAIFGSIIGLCGSAQGDFSLPGTASVSNMVDTGSYDAGTQLVLTVTGTVSLGGTWITHPDGSLNGGVTEAGYDYVNVGSTDYPTNFGGDGINHYAGGGANYDFENTTPFGPAGLQSTDTTNPNTIRLGAAIGTFSLNPGRSDFFYIGYGTTITVPNVASHLYLAVEDTYYPNNSGAYGVRVTPSAVVPEPSTLVLSGISALLGVGAYVRIRRRA